MVSALTITWLTFCLFFLISCNPTPLTPTGKATVTPAQNDAANPQSSPTPLLISQGTPESKTVSIINIDPQSLEGVTVNLWHFWPQERITPLIEEFNTTNSWGIVVKATQFDSSNDLSDALLATQPGDQEPQVAMGYIDQELTWDAKKKLVDLTPYVNDPIWGLSVQEQADYLPIIWDEGMLNDKRINLPAQASGQLMFYNQTWAQELGFSTPPQTPDEFLIQACAANTQMKADKTVSNDAVGGWLVNTETPTLTAWIYAYGGEIASSKTEKYYFNTSHTEEAFTFLKTLYDKNCAWVSDEPYPDENFAQRRALFVTGSLGDIPFIKQAFLETRNYDEWLVMPFPSPVGQPLITISITSFVLHPDTQEKQLAGWLFVKWLQSAANQGTWSRLTGDFPIRTSTGSLMADYAQSHPQWANALSLLPSARRTPSLASWSSVQWILEDAGSQLFKSYFKLERLEAMLAEMEKTAAELASK